MAEDALSSHFANWKNLLEAHTTEGNEVDDRAFIQYRGMRVNRDWMEEIKRAQEKATYMINRQVFERLAFGEEPGLTWDPKSACPGCAVRISEYHVSGCEYERCPACLKPALECECDYSDD